MTAGTRDTERESRRFRAALEAWQDAQDTRDGEHWPTGRDEYIAHRVLARYGVPGTAHFKKKTAHL